MIRTNFTVIALLTLLILAGCSDSARERLEESAAQAGTTFESEVSVRSDLEAADGGAAALYRTGERARFTLYDVNGTYEVRVRARGDYHEGWPEMHLNVDGQRVGDKVTVDSATYQEKAFAETSLDAGQVLEVVFVNDHWGGSPDRDRNLYVDHLTLIPVAADAQPQPKPKPPSKETRSSCTTDHLYTGDRFSPAWTSGDFAGTFCREVAGDGEYLSLTLDVQAGGFDTGVAAQYEPTRVDDLSAPFPVSATVTPEFSGPGSWWVGPKLLVQEERYYNGLEGDYENYVVENASQSPESYHAWLSGNGSYLGETYQDGGAYKHYLTRHRTWEQFWAVRQDYRKGGSVDMAQIIAMWRQNGLPNEFVGGVKVNVETSKEIRGTLTMANLTFPASITD